MMTRFVYLSIALVLTTAVRAQEKWDLKKCVEYAWEHNISIQQSDIQSKLSVLNYEQARWERYPNANFSTNTGMQFGRSIDPTTNLFTNTQLLGQGFSFSAGMVLFNWNRIKNNIVAARFGSEAAKMDVEKARNDVGLNVASMYLQVLLSREQARIARVQMQQTMTQLKATRVRVEAGGLPELNALTLESQYATDSSNYITALSTADQNLLQLKTLMNVDAAQDFDIATPPVDMIPVEPLAELQPETVYALAVTNQPAQKANELRLKQYQALLKVAKASLYPTISIGGGLGTNFASSNKKITGFSFSGYQAADPMGPVADNNGTLYPILTPKITYTQSKKTFGEMWQGWGTQFNNNFRQNLGITISVPILNGGSAHFGLERTKLNYRNAEISKEQADQTLKNNIYSAYYASEAALEKYNATKMAVEANQKTYDFSQKRYDLGLLSTVDLIIAQNNLTRARLDMTLAHFDYVFKMKVLEFYKGMGLRLQ